MQYQLRPGEKVLFDGDASIFFSRFEMKSTEALITDQRMLVAEGQRIFEKADIQSATAEKHGWNTKIVFKLRNGQSIAFTAPNVAGFKAAVMILTGQSAADSMPKGRELSQVKNRSAWVAAFGPWISITLTAILTIGLWGSPEHWKFRTHVYHYSVWIAITWLFLKLDEISLQAQGFSTKQLGLAKSETGPYYLFSRAKVFGHSKAYAITWCVLAGFVVLVAVL